MFSDVRVVDCNDESGFPVGKILADLGRRASASTAGRCSASCSVFRKPSTRAS